MKKLVLILVVLAVFATASLGARLTVGAKNFTEQYVVSSMISQLLSNAGFNVREDFGMSSFVVRNALVTGQIDLYADYTGTAWTAYFGHEEIPRDPVELYEKVAAQDLEENNIVWLEMAPFNNTYALAVTAGFAREHGLATVSDLAELSQENPDLRYGIEFEFLDRPDGFFPMAELYGIEVTRRNVSAMEIGLTYEAAARGEIDVAMVFATDGLLERFDLVVLEDDLHFFPAYNIAVTVRKEVLDEHPEIREILRPIALYLSEPTMIRLNYLVDTEGYEPDEVAGMFLRGLGLID